MKEGNVKYLLLILPLMLLAVGLAFIYPGMSFLEIKYKLGGFILPIMLVGGFAIWIVSSLCIKYYRKGPTENEVAETQELDHKNHERK